MKQHTVDNLTFDVHVITDPPHGYIHLGMSGHPSVLIDLKQDLAEVIDVLILDAEMSPEDADTIGVFLVNEYG